MHLRLFISSTIALAISAVAQPATISNFQVAQLRLWGETGCAAPSLGDIGINDSQLSQCLAFDEAVKSVTYESGLRSCQRKISQMLK